MFDNIVLIHIQDYRRSNKELQNPAKTLKKYGAFILSTCARLIFLLDNPTDEQCKKIDGLFAKQETKLYQRLSGYDAYIFLLLWGSGGLTTNIDHNKDSRILGQIREAIDTHSRKTAQPIKERMPSYMKLFTFLINDIRKVIAVRIRHRPEDLVGKSNLLQKAAKKHAQKTEKKIEASQKRKTRMMC